MDEFAAEARGGPDDHSGIGADIRNYRTGWSDPATFHRYVADLLAAARPENPRSEGIVPQSTLWYADSSPDPDDADHTAAVPDTPTSGTGVR